VAIAKVTDLVEEATRRKVVVIDCSLKAASVPTATIERIPLGLDVVHVNECGAIVAADGCGEEGHTVQRNTNRVCGALHFGFRHVDTPGSAQHR
jgi:hypothetical protein